MASQIAPRMAGEGKPKKWRVDQSNIPTVKERISMRFESVERRLDRYFAKNNSADTCVQKLWKKVSVYGRSL